MPENAPVTGALRVVFLVLLVLLAVALTQTKPRPRLLLRVYASIGSLVAFLGMIFAIDVGATDHELWTWVVAPIALAVFSLYAEVFRTREPSMAVAALLRRKHRLPLLRWKHRLPRPRHFVAVGEDRAFAPLRPGAHAAALPPAAGVQRLSGST